MYQYNTILNISACVVYHLSAEPKILKILQECKTNETKVKKQNFFLAVNNIMQ